MARILYGVHGIGHGHAMRALTLARHFPEHEFLFLSHDTGAAILGQEFPVEHCPNPPNCLCPRQSWALSGDVFAVYPAPRRKS